MDVILEQSRIAHREQAFQSFLNLEKWISIICPQIPLFPCTIQNTWVKLPFKDFLAFEKNKQFKLGMVAYI